MEKIRNWCVSHSIGMKLTVTLLYLSLVSLAGVFGIPCLFRAVTKIPCPGCGMTRACLAVLTLRPLDALSFHPMVWSVPLAYLYFLTDGRLFGKTADRVILWAIAAGFVLTFLIRAAAVLF